MFDFAVWITIIGLVLLCIATAIEYGVGTKQAGDDWLEIVRLERRADGGPSAVVTAEDPWPQVVIAGGANRTGQSDSIVAPTLPLVITGPAFAKGDGGGTVPANPTVVISGSPRWTGDGGGIVEPTPPVLIADSAPGTGNSETIDVIKPSEPHPSFNFYGNFFVITRLKHQLEEEAHASDHQSR